MKANFPAIHHLVSTVDQPASYRVINHEDGSVTVAMWMEFSRFTEKYNSDYWGRYTNMMLSQHVTLRPGRNDFQVAWRITNPAPYQQSAKIWNDALFPRNHTPKGVVQGEADPPPTDTEIIFPTRYVSDHHAKNFRRYDPNEGRIGAITTPHTSTFALAMPYGFAGTWYPSVKVNRLRLCDPNTAPGAKLYFRGEGTFKPGDVADSHMYNFIELFGSMDNIMEGVENWLAPGATLQYSHRYTFIKGIGRANFANEHAAIHLKLDANAPALEAVTPSPVEKLSASLDGRALGEAQPCAPDKPARFALPAGTRGGRVILKAGDNTIVDQQFPLPIPDDTSRHDRIRQYNNRKNTDSLERYGDQFGYFDALRRLVTAEAVKQGAAKGKPAASKPATAPAPPPLALGRLQYRAGLIADAVKTLREVTGADPNDGQAWHLLGCALLEMNPASAKPTPQSLESGEAFAKALSACQPYPPARYFLALAALRDGKAADARTELQSLLKERPGHWEARLLTVWLDAGDESNRNSALADLMAMDREDPADPRVQMARMFAAEQAGDEKLAAAAREALTGLSKEPGAARRLREFNAAVRGVYYPPQRMQLEEQMTSGAIP